MKQANHAPQSLWRRRLPGYAAMGAATLAMALGLGGLMHSRTTVAGTALPLADADAATYGVSAVYQLDDTTYYVVGSKQGFQSEVQAGVTLDRDGNVLDVKILAQAETDSLGAQCENPEFTAQYQGAAPFTLADKRYTVTDPATARLCCRRQRRDRRCPAEPSTPPHGVRAIPPRRPRLPGRCMKPG